MHRWREKARLTGWMLLLACLGTPWMRAQGYTTTVQDTVTDASGVPAVGTVVVSWAAFTTALGVAVPAGSLSTTLGSGGALHVSLQPNAGATPMGSYYTAIYHLSDGTTSREFWVVPVMLSGTAKLAAIRNQVLPTSVAMQTVSKQYVDTTVAKALAGIAPSGNGVPYLVKSGDSMAGPLTLPADPVQDLQAADKHYVDTAVAGVTLNGGAGGDLLGAFPNPTVSAVHATSGTLSGVTTADRTPAAATAVGNARSALADADWHARLRWFKQQRPNFAVTTFAQIPFQAASLTAAGTAPIRAEGCPPSQIVTLSNYPVAGYQKCATAQSYTRLWRNSVLVSSDVIGTPIANSGQHYRWWVDGAPLGYFVQTPADGTLTYVQLSLKDGRQHRVSFEVDGTFGGFLTPNGSADLAAPDWPLGPRIAWFGDSLSEPTITGSFTGYLGYPYVAAELLKWNNYIDYGEGGTGYTNDASGARATWLGHMSTDGCAYSASGGTGFDAYVFAGTVNDGGATGAAIQTAAYNTYAAAHLCSPNATLLVFGPVNGNNGLNNSGSTAAVEAALQGAVAQAVAAGIRAVYIAAPTMEEWATVADSVRTGLCPNLSNGGVNCPGTGDGSPHPTQLWHEFLGVTVAQRVAAAAPYLTNLTDTTFPLAEAANAKVIHRNPILSGLWTFSSSSAAVTGTGGNALQEISAGDVVSYNTNAGPFTVLAVTDANHFTLTATPPSYWIAGGNPTGLQLAQGWPVQRADLANGTVQISGLSAGSVSAGSFHEALTTPASSSAPCAAGDFADDANYHYVCVAGSTWKRVALSPF